LVGPNGEQVGIVRVEDALRLAQEADLDLVEVAPQARPPVCKLMDFGKFKYESAMKAREARKNQAHTVLKEIRLRLKIDPHDYGTKRGHVERFLKAGDKVKVMIMFRGREQSRPELGYRLLQRMATDVAEYGYVESTPKQDGRNMIMVIGPHKKKAEARAEQRRRREEEADLGPVTPPAGVAAISAGAGPADAAAHLAPAGRARSATETAADEAGVQEAAPAASATRASGATRTAASSAATRATGSTRSAAGTGAAKAAGATTTRSAGTTTTRTTRAAASSAAASSAAAEPAPPAEAASASPAARETEGTNGAPPKPPRPTPPRAKRPVAVPERQASTET